MRRGQHAKTGLGRRIVVASGVLACLMLATFLLLHSAIMGLCDAARLADGSQAVLASANRLQRSVVDLEAGRRGYVITGNEGLLRPWNAARTALPAQARELRSLAAGAGATQDRRAEEIARLADSYLRDYSVPLVTEARQRPGVLGPNAVPAEDTRRADALRGRFDDFVRAQRLLAADQERRSAAATRRATLVAASAAVASLILILIFTAYLTRAIVWPVRRASVMASRLAGGGEPAIRMPEASMAEIGTLEHVFNEMAESLAANHARIRRVAGDQAALRRVATLVARAVSPREVFEAVAGELGAILGADFVVISRFEPDRMQTVVGSWKRPGHPEPVPPVGSRWSLEGKSLEAMVLRSGGPARMADYDRATSGIGVWARTRGIGSGVGGPVVVEGRLWGMVLALWEGSAAQPAETEGRMLEFTELVGTAMANAESRAKLTAARARVVAASDETRRRIERDLHDGAQQRLVSLGLELRAAEAAVPPGQEVLRERLSATASGLTGVLADLREISRGLHPAILSRAGLQPALKAFARRCGARVELSLRGLRRLDDRLEAAIYYILSEAVTNAVQQACASTVWVEVAMDDAAAWLSVRDDGIRGAEPGAGRGLIRLKDRVEALGGALQIQAAAEGGIHVLVRVPIWTG